MPAKLIGLRHHCLEVVVGSLLVTFTSGLFAQDIPAIPSIPTPPPASPGLMDFLTGLPFAKEKQDAMQDPLLLGNAQFPPDPIKAKAAEIKAEQMDAKNRIEAVRFLATVDCLEHGEVPAMLYEKLEKDPSEDVRYEAALALGVMLSRGRNYDVCSETCECSDCRHKRSKAKYRDVLHAAMKPPALDFLQGKIKKDLQILTETDLCKLPLKLPHLIFHHGQGISLGDLFKGGPLDVLHNGTVDSRRRDYCLGCCKPEIMQKLWIAANERLPNGCYKEPSIRVRRAAQNALDACPCLPTAPAPVNEIKEDVPPEPEIKETIGKLPLQLLQTPTTAVETASAASTLEALRGYCIVELKNRQFIKARKKFSSVFEGNKYYFSSSDAKNTFDTAPDSYAPGGSGIDLVHFKRTGKKVAGSFLREHNGRFYLFQNKKNWEKFQNNPTAYIAQSNNLSIVQIDHAEKTRQSNKSIVRTVDEEFVVLKPTVKTESPAVPLSKKKATSETTKSEPKIKSESKKKSTVSESKKDKITMLITPKRFRSAVTNSSSGPAGNAKANRPVIVQFPKGSCIVSFRNGRIAKANKKFAVTYNGVDYHFADADAKDQFETFPDTFAPARSGFDLVQLQNTGEKQFGRYVAIHDARMYFFVTKENAQAFIDAPNVYAR